MCTHTGGASERLVSRERGWAREWADRCASKPRVPGGRLPAPINTGVTSVHRVQGLLAAGGAGFAVGGSVLGLER